MTDAQRSAILKFNLWIGVRTPFDWIASEPVNGVRAQTIRALHDKGLVWRRGRYVGLTQAGLEMQHKQIATDPMSETN